MKKFPLNFHVDVDRFIPATEEEKEYILGKIMPRFVVAGLASVTTLSIIVAGIFANML